MTRISGPVAQPPSCAGGIGGLSRFADALNAVCPLSPLGCIVLNGKVFGLIINP